METPTQNPNPVQLTNPPKTQTTMTAPARAKIKLVKVVALREFKLEDITKDAHGQVIDDNSRMVKPGEIVSVTEKRAEQLCRRIDGAYAFSGERFIADGDIKRHDLTIARRATQRDVVKEEELPPEEVEA